MIFESDRIYDPRDEELRVLGSVYLLAQWRHRKEGPPYIKIGRKVVYKGDDLNAWLRSRRQETTDNRNIAVKAHAKKLRARQAAFDRGTPIRSLPYGGA